MRIVFVISLLISCNVTFSQSLERSVIGSVGHSYSDASLNVESTLGESFITTLSQSNVTLTQGFHQHDDFINTGIENHNIMIFTPYPNPFVNELYIDGLGSKEIEVYDVQGKVHFKGTVNNNILRTDQLDSGVYFIRVDAYVMKCIKM